MEVGVVHALPGRVRFEVRSRVPPGGVVGLLARELALAGVSEVEITYNPRTRRYLALAGRDVALRELIERVARAPEPSPDHWAALASAADQLATRRRVEPLAAAARIIVPRVARFLLARWLMPPLLRPIVTAYRTWPYLRAGAADMARGRLTVPALDASAIGASLAIGDVGSANTIAFLLDLGEALEDWTRAQARQNIAALYRGPAQPAWVIRDGVELRVEPHEVSAGDRVVARMGLRIPVDGVVVSGEASVNQAAMTGEAQAISKRPGLTVWAGSVVEEGQLVIEAQRVGDQTRFASIARLIEDADGTRGEIASHLERLAVRAVPYTFLAAGLVFLVTRSWLRAASVLVVDYACALKLATPLALKSAMLEAVHHGAAVKGGKYLETLARADVFVFDKTGTLTEARPSVREVIPMDGFTRDYVLRNAACLEEHFPHPVATAIVQQAVREKLEHEERHAKVDYVLAHGIASTLEGERVLVGNRHFVEEHEHVDTSRAAPHVAAAASKGLGVLYFAVGGRLAGLLVIDDPLLPNAREILGQIRALGVDRLVMITGDNEQAARTVARALGLTEVHAEVLPDEKTALIRTMQAQGHVIAMVGDGINDTAALAAADVGISLKHGAEIAREACHVLLLEGRLAALPATVTIARLALARVHRNFVFSVSANSLFLGLGLVGLAPASLLALLHNASTVATCWASLRPYIEAAPERPS
ncbi:MAG: heavy metal translocating P-type ATPase [Deltaproteobacteria bacterium]|nr:heavy metal translocating P-type ATPase [Deltaproteobacteria bacterium]